MIDVYKRQMEHTPKNILIRAVRDGKGKKNEAEIKALLDFLSVKPTLAELLWGSDVYKRQVWCGAGV